MRILFITHTLPFPRAKDGQTLIADAILRRLVRTHRVDLMAPGDLQKDVKAIRELSALGIHITLVPDENQSLIMHYLSGRFLTQPWFTSRHVTNELTKRVRVADASGEYDRIVLHSPFVASLLKGIQRTPVVLNAIDALSLFFDELKTQTFNPLKRLHYRNERRTAQRVEHLLFPRAASVTVVAEDDRRMIAHSSPHANVTVIPNGVDTDYFAPKADAERQGSIVFVGSMDYPPNVDAVLWFTKNVWPTVAQMHQHARLIIVGRNPVDRIRDLADDRITVTGTVNDIRPALDAASIVIAPLRFGTGFKNKVIEALSAGKAVIASPQSVKALDVTHGSELLLAATDAEWSKYITQLFIHPDERVRLGRAARGYAEGRSWKTVAKTYESTIINTHVPS